MPTMVRRIMLIACAAAVLAAPIPAHALFGGTFTPSKCVAGKVKCVTKLRSCFLKCHQKALQSGLAVDAGCLEKCRDKFDQDPAIPGKGCFAKLEAKGGCGASLGDAATFAAKVEAQVEEAMSQLVPAGTPQNKCTAGKTSCLNKYGSCILGLVRKAAQAGTPIGDTSKCTRYLDLAENTCVEKLERKYCTPSIACDSTAPPCLSFGDAIELRNQDDAFTDDAIFALESGPVDMNTQRCSGDTSVTCTSAPGGVAGCGGPLGTCEFFFSAPLPYGVGGFAICAVRQWNGSITGTFDQATGESAGTAAALSSVYVGHSIATPCPTCQGDGVPNDGTAGGTCVGGTRNGLACDGNGRSAEPSYGITSLDCPPAGLPVGTLRLDLSNTTAALTHTLAVTSPNCNGAPGKKCLCASCSGDASIPCMSDAECALAGAGTCTNTAGAPRRPNSCNDDSNLPGDGTLCVDVGGGDGVCPEGPAVQHCTIETFRSCVGPMDCPAPGDSCNASLRPCFPGYNGDVGDTITANGRAGDLRNGATPIGFGALFCTAPTGSAFVDAAVGYPGPARLELTGVGADDGGPACPTEASFLPTSKGGVLDSGWNGLGHGLRTVGQGKITVATVCAGTYPNCACSYAGPIANPNAP